jgi:hypothetical protein
MSLVIISRYVRPARMTRIMLIRALILSHYSPSPASSYDTDHAHPSSHTKSLSSKSGQLVWYGMNVSCDDLKACPASSCDTNHAHPSSGTKSLSSKSGQLVWYGCMSLVIISRHVRPARMTRIMPIRALILSHYPPSPASSYGTNECLL